MAIDQQDQVVRVRDLELAMDPDRSDQLLGRLLEMERGEPAVHREQRVERLELCLDVVEVRLDDPGWARISGHTRAVRSWWPRTPASQTLAGPIQTRPGEWGRSRSAAGARPGGRATTRCPAASA